MINISNIRLVDSDNNGRRALMIYIIALWLLDINDSSQQTSNIRLVDSDNNGRRALMIITIWLVGSENNGRRTFDDMHKFNMTGRQ